jgi:two-component system NtrC family sensor kinase
LAWAYVICEEIVAIPSTSVLDGESVSGQRDGELLGAIAEIARRLTEAGPSELVAQDVLERARAVLDALECSAWLYAPRGFIRGWGTGEELLTSNDVTRALNSAAGREAAARGRAVHRTVARAVEEVPDDGRMRAVVMRYGPRKVGALAIRLPESITQVQTQFVETLASMLAAFIAHSERARRLEGDLRTRVRELETQRHFTEGIVDSLPLGLYVIDRDYRVTVWNHKRETGMQGISRDQAIGRTIFEVLHRQPADLLRREFDEVFRTGRMQQFQSESRSTGDLRTYRLSKIPMRDASHRVTHIITIGEDITDWVEARERVSQNEKLAAIGRLAAGIMHEINNPLATIAACAESMTLGLAAEGSTATDTGVAGGGPEFLKIIEAEVQRCKRIVDGLLDFSRPRPLHRQSISANVVCERALFLLKHHARFKQLTVQLDLSDTLPMVHASSEQLIQVMIALLMNAADAMPEHGNVAVRTRGEGPSPDARLADSVVIEVQDQGVGIPRAQVARIFEPFYSTKEQGRGTGLGLAICYGIVAEHGGRIEVESEPGLGSTFRIILPAEAR